MATKASITVSVLFILTAALSSDTLAEKLEVKKVYLEAFQAVQICAPLSILVVPTYAKADDDKGLYSLKIEGEASVHQSIQGRVQDGILYVEANESFQIHANAKLTVALPHNSLKAISLRSASNVFIGPGFQAQALDLTATSLGGAITAEQLTANLLTLKANGLAAITALGNFEKTDIFADGGATVRVSGLRRKATVLLTGTPTIAIVTTSSDAQIKGMTQGSKVSYNKGTCSIKEGFNGIGIGACLKDTKLKVTATPMKWTCKATLNGAQMCSSSGTSSSSFSSVGSDCKTIIVPRNGEESPDKEEVTRTARRLRQSSSSTSSSSTTSTGGSTGASTFTYTSNTPSEGGSTSQTVCNFVNNVGTCQVNGTPVPVRQYGLGGVPVPAPSAGGEDILNAAIAAASSSNTQSTASGYASPGGTVCTFVNGIGGCSTG